MNIKNLILLIITLTSLGMAQMKQNSMVSENPFFTDYSAPLKTPPFDKIKNEHYKPAFTKGIEEQKKELALIINNESQPDFYNTIEAFEKSGELLKRVSSVFFSMTSAKTDDYLQNTSSEIAPLLSAHTDDIYLNEIFFSRVKKVYENKEKSNLSEAQKNLIDEIYKTFIRGGINLPPDKKESFRTINKELSLLSIKFANNILSETNKFKIVIDNKNDLDGLPGFVIENAADAAKSKGLEGKWVFTLHKPSLIPFLQYSKKRILREQLFKAYIERCNHNNEFDNKLLITKIANLRLEKAKLFGYSTHASFVLDENMAKKPEKVYAFLDQLWNAALPNAKKEAEELQKMIIKEGNNFKLEAWDWWYYSEKLRKEKYDLDENELRPYFKLENVLNGAFELANKLYGINFIERNDIPVYHPEVKVFEVKENDGRHLGILYTDYFPRSSKRSGAWMDQYRSYSNINDKEITPIVYNVGNFSKPTNDKPSLLSFEEVTTLFHEFGHALHGLFSKSKYSTLSRVPQDFVELPSQIMENWVKEPEVLKIFAKHYQTGEIIPQNLIEKITNSSLFNQGFVTTEYLSASYLDMDWHTIRDGNVDNVNEFENQSMRKINLIPEIVVRYRSPYFQHIFSGDYSAGYYSYIWAAVLDADAFEAFKETSLFNKDVALKFRKNVLEKGGTVNPMQNYIDFRGAEPKIDPLLKRRGLK